VTLGYLTDGRNLYEIASQRTVTNYGRAGGTISYTVLRDCVSLAEARVDDLTLVALEQIEPLREAA